MHSAQPAIFHGKTADRCPMMPQNSKVPSALPWVLRDFANKTKQTTVLLFTKHKRYVFQIGGALWVSVHDAADRTGHGLGACK